MRIPLSARIGIYLIAVGLALDLILHYAYHFEYFLPGIGGFSLFLLPVGILLLLGSVVLRLIEQRRLKNQWIPLTSPGPHPGGLDLEDGSLPFDPQKLRSFQSISAFSIAVVAIGVILLGIGLRLGFDRWLATRTNVPLSMAASFARGHIKTGDFYINLLEPFFIEVELDPSSPNSPCRFESVLKTHLTLYRDGQILGQDDGANYSNIGYFYAERKGNYSLDIEVLSDASCLDARHPRITVRAAENSYEEWSTYVRWISFLLALAGLGLFGRLIGNLSSRRTARGEDLAYISITRDYYPSIPRPLPRIFSGLPSFGLVCSLFLSWLVIIHMVYNLHPISRGLEVHLLRQAPLPQSRDYTVPLVLRVQDAGPGLRPKLYLNSKLLSWEELNGALKAELSWRRDWVFCVEADSAVPWQAALQAVDIARGLNARVVLLTREAESK